MNCVDTNVLIDILDKDPIWFDWSAAAVAESSSDGVSASAIVVAELSRGFNAFDELYATLDELDVVILSLDEASAFTGGKRFQEFRRVRKPGENARILPDFLIGAHALTLGVPLLTRDTRLYRRYFPELTLITPETDHG